MRSIDADALVCALYDAEGTAPTLGRSRIIEISDMVRMIEDAPTFEKAQEPQVLSFDEVKAISKSDSTVYVERRTKKFYEEMAFVHVEPVYGESVIFHGQKSIFSHPTRDYGKEYRCWTSRPTDEQRKEVKWDEP